MMNMKKNMNAILNGKEDKISIKSIFKKASPELLRTRPQVRLIQLGSKELRVTSSPNSR